MFDSLEEDEDTIKVEAPKVTQTSASMFDSLDEDEPAQPVENPNPSTGGSSMFNELPETEFNIQPAPLAIEEPEDEDALVNPPVAVATKDEIEEAIPTERSITDILSDAYAREYKQRQQGSERDIKAETDELVDFTNDLVNTAIKRYGYTREEAERQVAASQEKQADKRLALTADTAEINVRDDIVDDLESSMDSLIYRLESENFITSGLTETLLPLLDNGTLTLDQVNYIVSADEFLNPATAVVDIPIVFRDGIELVRQGEYGWAALNFAAAGLDAVAPMAVARKGLQGVNKVWEKASGGASAYKDIQKAMALENDIADSIKASNKAKANENKELRTRLIKEFEERNKVTISNTLDDGNLEIDTTKVRETGKSKVTDFYIDDVYHGRDGKSVATSLDDLSIGDHELAIPMLNPEKMDAFVGVVVDLQKAYPDAFKGDGPLVDKIFDLTVMKPNAVNDTLFETTELYDILNKHGMSYEEYVLGAVGSGSQAGKLMNRLSQMSRIKPRSVAEQQAEKARYAAQNAIGKFWNNTVIRGENIRRGLMVSAFATAARNAQSAFVRAPMESLGNVFDTAIITYSKAITEGDTTLSALNKSVKNINPLVRDGTWSDSFRNMKYLFKNQKEAEEWTNYILDRPELLDQLNKMQNGINEIQEATGRGQAVTKVGKGLDAAVSQVEDLVQFVNGPNRWQEHIVRRATFLAELERLTKAEWGIDLKKTLNEGRIQDVLNDAPDLRGADGRSFTDIMEEATNKALDVTYAKAPDLEQFRQISNFITKSGLTTIVPFPRFMFNSMDYMAQNVGGAGMVALRKAVSKESRAAGFTARDRQDIARNLTGFAAISAFYMYRSSDDAPEKYETLTYEDSQYDTTAIFPLRQMAWVAEFAKRKNEGTLDSWYGMEMDHIAETWIGTTARTGMGNIFLEEIRDIIVSTDDEVDEQARAKKIGGAVGQYTMTYFTPYFQIVDAQRAMDIRRKDYADAALDPTFKDDWSGAFASGFQRSAVQRGMAAPSYEYELPARVSITRGDIERVDPAYKLFFGLNKKAIETDMEEYLTSIGYDDPTYQLGSRSKIPSEKRAENWYLSQVLPMAVDIARGFSEEYATTEKDKIKVSRKFLTDILDQSKNEFVASNYSSPMAQAVERLSKLGKVDRQYALLMFKEEFGEAPDLTSLEDISILVNMSKSIAK